MGNAQYSSDPSTLSSLPALQVIHFTEHSLLRQTALRPFEDLILHFQTSPPDLTDPTAL